MMDGRWARAGRVAGRHRCPRPQAVPQAVRIGTVGYLLALLPAPLDSLDTLPCAVSVVRAGRQRLEGGGGSQRPTAALLPVILPRKPAA